MPLGIINTAINSHKLSLHGEQLSLVLTRHLCFATSFNVLHMNFHDTEVQAPKEARKHAMDPKIGESVALNDLATSVRRSDVLLTRTVTGVASNANKGKEARPPLTLQKVAFLRGGGKSPDTILI